MKFLGECLVGDTEPQQCEQSHGAVVGGDALVEVCMKP